jgi:hypothetical protein
MTRSSQIQPKNINSVKSMIHRSRGLIKPLQIDHVKQVITINQDPVIVGVLFTSKKDNGIILRFDQTLIKTNSLE